MRHVFATLGFIENEPDVFTPEPGFVSLFNGHDLTAIFGDYFFHLIDNGIDLWVIKTGVHNERRLVNLLLLCHIYVPFGLL